MRPLALISLVCLPGISTAAADPPPSPVIRLDLPRAIEMALANNFQIQARQVEPQIARARQRAASGKFDPSLEISYTRDQNRQELRTLDTDLQAPSPSPANPNPDLFALSTSNVTGGSITGSVPWGLTYDLGVSVTWDTSSRRSTDFTRYDTFLGVGLTQPLLRNFGTDANLAELRIARADRALSGWRLRGEAAEIITRTIRIYSELCFALENLAVETRSRDLAARLVSDNMKRAEIGVMAPLDVLQARADLAARQERVLVAARAAADNENFLKELITSEIAGILDIRLQPSPPRLPPLPPVDRSRDFARALELRPDYREALLEIQKRNIQIVFTRNQALPRLDLVSSLGINGIDTSLAASFERATGGGSNTWAWTIGAIFSMPIPNRKGSGELEAAKREVARALLALKSLEQRILVEADNAAGQIETTAQRIAAAAAARELAAATLEAAQTRLASGTTTTFEVLQFQRDLAAAEVAELRARADHIIARAEYDRVVGTTLQNYRVVVDEQGASVPSPQPSP